MLFSSSLLLTVAILGAYLVWGMIAINCYSRKIHREILEPWKKLKFPHVKLIDTYTDEQILEQIRLFEENDKVRIEYNKHDAHFQKLYDAAIDGYKRFRPFAATPFQWARILREPFDENHA